MKFQALMVSVDDGSAQELTEICDSLLVDYEYSTSADAPAKFEDARVDLLVLGFDDASAGESLIAALRRSSLSKTAVTLALLRNRSGVAQAFGAGANFVLFQPLSTDNARSTLRAALALLQRERRRQFRVPVQLPVTLNSDGVQELEGIMLDLSEGGMDVLAAKALQPGQAVNVKFCLPSASDLLLNANVVWANSNGQSGLQFVEFSQEKSRTLSSWLGSNAPQVAPEDPEPLSEYKLSDLSLGGCYIETLAPFPRSTRIDVCLRVGDFEIHLDAGVRVVYPGHGMGVAFTPSPEQRNLVVNFIDRLTGQSGATPDVLVWPKGFNFKSSMDSSAHDCLSGDDALLELLNQRSSLGQDEFLAELRRQRNSSAEVTTA